MKYIGVNGSGNTWNLKATNDIDAILEAYNDMEWGFNIESEKDFNDDKCNGRLNCYIDCYADNSEDSDDPIASASISWMYDNQQKEIHVILFDDTELTIKEHEDFAEAVKRTINKN